MPETAIPRFAGVGSLAVAGAAIWQRLTFDRWLDAPPPVLSVIAGLAIGGLLGAHLLSGDAARRGAAMLAGLASAIELWTLGWPELTDLETYRFGMARHFSTTWHGLPLHALTAMTGLLAYAFLSTQSMKGRAAGASLAAIVLLFGATTVLGYATGSPWPFGS